MLRALGLLDQAAAAHGWTLDYVLAAPDPLVAAVGLPAERVTYLGALRGWRRWPARVRLGLAALRLARRARGADVFYSATLSSFPPCLLAGALADVRAAVPEVRALLVGAFPDAAYAARVDRRVAALGLRDAVTVSGFLPNPFPVVRGLDVLVHPARRDPFPLALLEAMALARPIVAAAVGGIPEMLVDGESGVLVPPDDAPALGRALVALLRDPARRARHRRPARRHRGGAQSWRGGCAGPVHRLPRLRRPGAAGAAGRAGGISAGASRRRRRDPERPHAARRPAVDPAARGAGSRVPAGWCRRGVSLEPRPAPGHVFHATERGGDGTTRPDVRHPRRPRSGPAPHGALPGGLSRPRRVHVPRAPRRGRPRSDEGARGVDPTRGEARARASRSPAGGRPERVRTPPGAPLRPARDHPARGWRRRRRARCARPRAGIAYTRSSLSSPDHVATRAGGLMRVAVMHRRLTRGGTEGDLRRLASGLAARGHDVHVFCAPAGADRKSTRLNSSH